MKRKTGLLLVNQYVAVGGGFDGAFGISLADVTLSLCRQDNSLALF